MHEGRTSEKSIDSEEVQRPGMKENESNRSLVDIGMRTGMRMDQMWTTQGSAIVVYLINISAASANSDRTADCLSSAS